MKEYPLLLPAIITFLLASQAFAGGFVVNPSTVRIENVSIGRSFEVLSSTSTDHFLEIFNGEDNPETCSLEFYTCQEAGYPLFLGYDDLPDLHWIRSKNLQIAVPAHKKGYFKGVHITIPEGNGRDGKNYQAVAKVTGTNQSRQGINIEVLVPVFIRTRKEAPGGY